MPKCVQPFVGVFGAGFCHCIGWADRKLPRLITRHKTLNSVFHHFKRFFISAPVGGDTYLGGVGAPTPFAVKILTVVVRNQNLESPCVIISVGLDGVLLLRAEGLAVVIVG